MKRDFRKTAAFLLLAACLAFFSSCTGEPKPPTTAGPTQPSENTSSGSSSYIPSEPDAFPYTIRLEELVIPDFKGLHSYAYGQHDGKWLLVGGRTDGLHARQPVAAFPGADNNKNLIVMDPETKEVWSAALDALPAEIREHLQASNMNFYQSGDTLFIIGGYAYSETARGHITFPKLTTLQVSDVIEDVINGQLDPQAFGHLADQRFAVTGGQLGKIGEDLYLVGGHRFDGRYTPQASRQNTQVYTNAIQRFSIDTTGTAPVVDGYSSRVDPDHLRRRDYNLVPYLFADGRPGYLISTGVFQASADLPFLTVVEIDADSYYPVAGFKQTLSHYHSPKLALTDSSQQALHMIFFGGLAQFYYEDGVRKQDDLVPFVSTISRVTRTADGAFTEHVLPISMPGFAGTSAEFIPNTNLPRSETGVFLLDWPMSGPVLIGHMVGGIASPAANPFSLNQTGQTSADPRIFCIWVE
ncbi:MAG: hypothetical protein M0P55_05530 [Clostridiales bacterium]|nr:hypothetical protein [Clostridiales bacterium]